MADQKQKYAKVSRPGLGWYIANLGDAIQELETSFEADEEGDQVTFEVVKMTEAEFKALPEFEGW